MAWREENLEQEKAKRAANREHENELARARHKANPEADRAKTRKWQKANPDKVRERNAAVYHSSPERCKERSAAWKAANPDRVREKAAEWRKGNPDKIKLQNDKQYAKADKQKRYESGKAWQDANREKVRASVRKWNHNNPEKVVVLLHKRRYSRKIAIPTWANTFFMQEAYHLARLRTEMFGFQWHVDHIVPLQSPLVCGLHTEQNMQVIPGKTNSSKGNRVWPDMPEVMGA